MSKYVRQIIRDKGQWHHQVSPDEKALGFRGWYSRGYLPHFDAPGVRQMITYRLGDAMPASRRHEWSALLAIEDEREKRKEIEAYLDRGLGQCPLRDPSIATLVEENLLHFDGKFYRLFAWVIMPNHVHVLVEMGDVPLAHVLKAWKSYTSKEANRVLRRQGRFWEPEYFDRYIRDEEHFHKAVRYIENNPLKAGLVKEAKDWLWSSAAPRSADGPSAKTELHQPLQRADKLSALL
jgi:putative DNA methylase